MNRIRGKEFFALLGITLVAALLRVHNLGDWPLFGDEVNTIVESRNFSIFSDFAATNRWTTMTNSLSHLLTYCSFGLLGETLFAARLVPVSFGILTIPVFYFLIRKLLQARIAFLASLLIAFSPNLIFISGFARYNSMLFFMGGAAFLTFLIGLVQRRFVYLLMGFVLSFFAMMAHITGAMVLGVMLLAACVFAMQNRKERRRGFLIIICIFFLLLILYIIFKEDVDWLRYVIVQTFMGKGLGYSPPRMIASIAYNDGILHAVLVVLAVILAFMSRKTVEMAIALYWLLPFLLIVLAGFWFDVGPRYLHSALPGFYLLAAIGLAAWLDRMESGPKLAQVFLVLFILFSQVPLLASNWRDGGRYDTISTARFMMEHHERFPNDKLFAEGHMIYEYLSEDRLDVHEIPGNLSAFLESLRGVRRALIAFPVQRKVPMGIMGREFKVWLERNCKQIKVFDSKRFDFMSYEILVYQYEPS